MEDSIKLKKQLKELKARLDEAEETLDAIRSGAVDALVVSCPDGKGNQIFTLQGAETPYRILVEEMNQGALMLIPDGTILYANKRFSELAKTPLQKVIGSTWQQFFPKEQHRQFQNCLQATSPACAQDQFKLQAGDGSLRPIQVSAHSMHDSDVGAISVIITDLTERQQSEDALRKTSEELLEKVGELEAFSYSISHDMRQPLRAMQGYARILNEDYGDKLGSEPKLFLDRIESAASRLDRLIHDVLSYSRVLRAQHEAVPLDLDEMVREVIETYPDLRESQIEFAPSSARVLGYEVALAQCISNLLANAIKFVPPGRTSRVKVWAEPKNGRWRLWVEDNGIGIAPKDQKRIFDIFSRVHGNEQYEGTGIGLSMVKKAVEKMGGSVGVQSELGLGSRFWIELEKAP